ncbi:MAG: hypothetical protein WC765_07715 [Phycisphaerae bacterium]
MLPSRLRGGEFCNPSFEKICGNLCESAATPSGDLAAEGASFSRKRGFHAAKGCVGFLHAFQYAIREFKANAEEYIRFFREN